MSPLFGDSTFFTEQMRQHSLPSSNSYVHVLVHSTNGDDDPNDNPQRCDEPFQLTPDLWICRLPDELRDVVYQACESPGVPLQKVTRQYGQLYAAALFTGPWTPGQLSGWDAPGQITLFVTFSQLVHPTSLGFGSSARLTFGPNGEFLSADPGPCRGMTEQAFTIPHHRNWLSASECARIKALIKNADLKKLPDKVARAHWNVQHAAYQYFFEVRAMLVVSGLEALLHTRIPKPQKGKSRGAKTGEQFINRTKQLADLLKIPFTLSESAAIWEHRSDVVHGRDPWAARQNARGVPSRPPELTKADETVKLYLQAERLLRDAVLRCLEDSTFSALFASDDSVAQGFPL